MKRVDHNLLRAAATMGVAARDAACAVVLLPAALPAILVGMRIGLGVAWTAIIAAELAVGAKAGGGDGRHRPDDVRVLRVQRRAQPHRRVHDRRRHRRARFSTACFARRFMPPLPWSRAMTAATRSEDQACACAQGVRRNAARRSWPSTDLTLDIAPGEFLVIVGPSGCGKTTVLNMLAGLERRTSGTMTLDGRAIPGPGPERGVMFQDYALFPWQTVRGNVDFGLRHGPAGHGLDRGRAARPRARVRSISSG